MAAYGKKAHDKVEKVMKERNAGTLKSGGSGKKVTSRKQAIAIGLSEARRAGGKVPSKKTSSQKSVSSKKSASKKSSSTTKSVSKKSGSKKSSSKSTSKKVVVEEVVEKKVVRSSVAAASAGERRSAVVCVARELQRRRSRRRPTSSAERGVLVATYSRGAVVTGSGGSSEGPPRPTPTRFRFPRKSVRNQSASISSPTVT